MQKSYKLSRIDSGNCLIFFAKYPATSAVKSRLAEKIGDKAAAVVYRNFVSDMLAVLENLDMTLKIFYTPADARERFRRWLGGRYSYCPQTGDDLGERMKNAFERVFANSFARAVLIGSDLPDLPEDFLTEAFRSLGSKDVVVGPSTDGGYYLIGFSKDSFLPQAFDDIAWSSTAVHEQTLDLLNEHGRGVHLLPRWRDVDTLVDLKSLISRNKNTAFRQSKTFSYLMQNSEEIHVKKS